MSSASSAARSWLPTRQTEQRSWTRVGALVGLGAVADHVAEAPGCSTSAAVDVGEHRLERRQVGVDVAEQGETHWGPPRCADREADRRPRRRTIVGADELGGVQTAGSTAPRLGYASPAALDRGPHRRRRGGDDRRRRGGGLAAGPARPAPEPGPGRRERLLQRRASSSAPRTYRDGQRLLLIAGIAVEAAVLVAVALGRPAPLSAGARPARGAGRCSAPRPRAAGSRS